MWQPLTIFTWQRRRKRRREGRTDITRIRIYMYGLGNQLSTRTHTYMKLHPAEGAGGRVRSVDVQSPDIQV